MTLQLYINCATVGILGIILSTLLIIKSLSTKAKLANVRFDVSDYLLSDWFTPVSSLVMLGMAMMFIPYIPTTFSQLYLMLIFATGGYTGSDLASRLFSVVNKRINAAIDYKTTIADTANGTLDCPTPAAPINPKP